MRRISALALFAIVLSLSACNPVRGFSEDLRSVANAGDEVT